MAKTPLSVHKFLLAFIGWWVTWALMQAWILNSLGYSWQLSFIDSFLSNILLAATCTLVSNNLQYYLPQKERYGYLLVLSLVLSLLWLVVTHYLLPMVVQPEGDYNEFLSKSLPVRFGIAFLLVACMAMISVLWYTFEQQKQQAQRKSEAEQLSKDAELYKLRQQLQPHFLFNSLNSINALIGMEPVQARKMVQQLSDFLRGTLKREEHQWVTLQEELQHLQLYLDIEKVRFGNRLSTEFKTSEASLTMKLPAMLLQPLVENAIKFGLYDTIGETVIHINTDADDRMLIIKVENPFDAETSDPKKGTGFGLNSVQRRLHLLFARNDLVTTAASENIFTTTVKIPQVL